VTRCLFALVLLLGAATSLSAQEATRPPLQLVPRGDTVFVYVDVPADAGGFLVYRSRAGEAMARVTAEPVRREREPAMAAGILGSDLPMAMQAFRASDEGELFRRLRSDRFGAAVLSMLSRNVATALGRLYVDAGLSPGAAYGYRVVFTDASGREGERALTAQVVVRDPALPPPGQTRSTARDREVIVGWSYPRYRGEASDVVVGFHVYRAEGPAAPLRRLTSTPVLRNDAAPLEYRDRDVRNGSSYRYQVTAVDLLGRESVPSGDGSASPVDRTPPAAPVGLAVRNGDGTVLVTWRLSPEVDVAGYHVERATGLNAPYTRLTTRPLPADAPILADSAVSGGRPYFYRVLAVDSAGNASEPSTAIAALPTDHTPPQSPTGVTATVQARRVTLRWAASPSRDVRGYFVYRGESADRMTRLLSRPLEGALQFADSGFGTTGLVPGGHYVVRVTAVDSAFNESAPVTVEVAVPDDEPPSAPGGFVARSVLGRYVELQWTASGALDVRSYAVSRSSGGEPAVPLGTVGREERSLPDTSAVRGRTYVYQLVAVDSAGNRSPEVADTLAFGDATPPAPPRFAAARASAAGVEVTWERVASADLVGYVVYRSGLPTGTYERVTARPVTELRFVDPAGRAGQFYVVRAVDSSRNESAPSPVAQAGGR
jgi:fibronectin type 3 domain-containing protein